MSMLAHSSCQAKDKDWIIYNARNPFFLRGAGKSRLKLLSQSELSSEPVMATDVNKQSILLCVRLQFCRSREVPG